MDRRKLTESGCRRQRGGGRRVGRGVWLVSVVAVVLVVFGAALASANSHPSISFVGPSPGEGATLTTSSVQFAFTYNRTPKQTRSLVCALSGPTSSSGPCDAPVASGTGPRSGKSYSGLAKGSYTFSVTLTLTDGGTVAATRHFSIAVRHLYWANDVTFTIGRANVDGTDPDQNFIPGVSNPSGWRSTPATSTGSTTARTRSGGRTWTGPYGTRTSSPAPQAPSGWRSTPARPHTRLCRAAAASRPAAACNPQDPPERRPQHQGPPDVPPDARPRASQQTTSARCCRRGPLLFSRGVAIVLHRKRTGRSRTRARRLRHRAQHDTLGSGQVASQECCK